MSSRFRRMLLLVLLMLLPVQGMASAFGALVCSVENGHAATLEHAHPGHDHGARHSHSEDGGRAGEVVNHLCCHHFSSAAAVVIPERAADIDLPVFQSSISLLETLFIPERPQKPPRA